MKTMKKTALSILVAWASCSLAPAQKPGVAPGLNEIEIRGLVEELGQLIMDHYVFPEVAEKIRAILRANLDKGDYQVRTCDELSDRLSRDLKSVNQDLHLNVWSISPDKKNTTESADLIVRHLHTIRNNAAGGYDFKKIEILEGNIGYLELTRFKSIPDSRLERMLEGAMDFLSGCSAVILDLRRNTGGNNLMIQKFMSYFFNKSVPLTGCYSRDAGGVAELRTREDFHHRYLADVPLFVLVSSRTVSGPEMVAYDLQVLKRAVIIGEKTKGAANPSRFFRIQEKLLVCVPYGYAVHPITESNWEGAGVTPDVIVPADAALSRAVGLAKDAAEKIREKEQDRVDRLAATLKEKMRDVESLLRTDPLRAERLFQETLDEFYRIEYMNQFLLLDWLDLYRAAGNTAASEMIGRQGIRRYPEEARFYTRMGDLYEEKGDFENARKTFSDLLKLNPNDMSAKNKLENINKKSRGN